ncbi:MAG: aminotransferase class V-fold PLP-dependent enzyme [Clostridiales bacterium]|nr:aminotransferase class V-fold PLP-dependent enzyme [Clostridiales bacterium]
MDSLVRNSIENYRKYGVSDRAVEAAVKAEESLSDVYARIDDIVTYNELKVLDAFRSEKFSDTHMGLTSGYGYDDVGREKIENIFAKVFGAEKAYVRWQISTGSQAISAMLYGALRPGDIMLSVTGRPYDTLMATIGLSAGNNDMSLRSYGIGYEEVDLLGDGSPDLEAIRAAIKPETKMVFIQKSRGYTGRRALLCDDIEKIAELVHSVREDIIVAVDNCYGEFTEKREPLEAGADVIAGSLIKNPGGGIARTGGYIAGRADLVENAARHLTTPGLGSEVGPTLGANSMIARGLFTAPACVGECLKGAVFAAEILEGEGYKTSPSSREIRGDIVQTIEFGDPGKMSEFCAAIQSCSPVDSFVTPVPWDMPGYDDQVIMAAGAFVQGATTELSCDGPMKPPYIAYMQGSLAKEQAKLACMLAVGGK